MFKVIAISGWKGSGKDTIANYLCNNMGYTKFSFAAALKDLVAAQYNIPREWCDDRDFKERPLNQYPVNASDKFGEHIHEIMNKEFALAPIEKSGYLDLTVNNPKFYWTPRALCILEGSVKRSVNSDYWVKQVIEQIRRCSYANISGEPQGRFVISDLRYISEAEQLKQAFGEQVDLIRINRFTSTTSQDPSERDLDNYSGFTYTLNTANKSITQVNKTISIIYGDTNGNS